MSRQQDYVPASKPSASFSTVSSSAASATSAGTSRSGGSRLLFGEIDTSSERSTSTYASVCNFVLSDSSVFLKFWLEDACRTTFLSYLEPSDLASLRLTCHDFSVRAAPALFSHLTIRFRTNTFSKPSRIAALERCGFYVKTLKFVLPHSNETFLPPLVDPESGAELNFTYTPAVQETKGRPKFGDVGTTEILTRQWPPLFHAATNVPAFVRAFGALFNLEGLEISSPSVTPSSGAKDGVRKGKKSVVDFALISLRIAVERNCLNSLERLTVSPIHAQGVMFISPVLGIGAGPSAMRRWVRIKKLEIGVECTGDEAEVKLVRAYLRSFQKNLQELRFSWVGEKGPLPIATPMSAAQTQQMPVTATRPLFGEQRPHPAYTRQPLPSQHSQQPQQKGLHFPSLKHLELTNIICPSTDLSTFISSHRHTLEELDFQNFELTSGTWEEALQPLTSRSKQRRKLVQQQRGDIPIMLYPAPMERIEVPERKSVRLSSSSATTATTVARRVREGLLGCEMQLKKVLRGSAFPWK